MTIKELRDMFTSETEIYLVNEKSEEIKINNMLMGISEFADINIVIRTLSAIRKNVVTIKTYMPDIVFNAWEKYAEKYEKEEELKEKMRNLYL